MHRTLLTRAAKISVVGLGYGELPVSLQFARLSGARSGRSLCPDRSFFPSPDYDSTQWWRYSDGAREVVRKSIAYVYARFFFYPSRIEANVN
jgi:hypothetical protein